MMTPRGISDVQVYTPERVLARYGVRPDQVGHFPVPGLSVLKIFYPRRDPQGGMIERDLHGGQQFCRILNQELA